MNAYVISLERRPDSACRSHIGYELLMICCCIQLSDYIVNTVNDWQIAEHLQSFNDAENVMRLPCRARASVNKVQRSNCCSVSSNRFRNQSESIFGSEHGSWSCYQQNEPGKSLASVFTHSRALEIIIWTKETEWYLAPMQWPTWSFTSVCV